MMVLVLVFLILNTPRLILGLIEVTEMNAVKKCFEQGKNYELTKETYILDFIARCLVILNSSVNFLIYCLAGSEFRSKLLIWMDWRRIEIMSRRREGRRLRKGNDTNERAELSCHGFTVLNLIWRQFNSVQFSILTGNKIKIVLGSKQPCWGLWGGGNKY